MTPGPAAFSLLPPAQAFDSHSKRMTLWQKIKPQEAKRKERRGETASLLGQQRDSHSSKAPQPHTSQLTGKRAVCFGKGMWWKWNQRCMWNFVSTLRNFPLEGFGGSVFFQGTVANSSVLNIGWITELREEQLEREIHTKRTRNKEHS